MNRVKCLSNVRSILYNLHDMNCNHVAEAGMINEDETPWLKKESKKLFLFMPPGSRDTPQNNTADTIWGKPVFFLSFFLIKLSTWTKTHDIFHVPVHRTIIKVWFLSYFSMKLVSDVSMNTECGSCTWRQHTG